MKKKSLKNQIYSIVKADLSKKQLRRVWCLLTLESHSSQITSMTSFLMRLRSYQTQNISFDQWINAIEQEAISGKYNLDLHDMWWYLRDRSDTDEVTKIRNNATIVYHKNYAKIKLKKKHWKRLIKLINNLDRFRNENIENSGVLNLFENMEV